MISLIRLFASGMLFSAFRPQDVSYQSLKITVVQSSVPANLVGHVVPVPSFKELMVFVCCDDNDSIHYLFHDGGVLKRCVWSSFIGRYERAVIYNELYNWYSGVNVNGSNITSDLSADCDAAAWELFETVRPMDGYSPTDD